MFDKDKKTLVWHEPFWQLLCDVRKYSREGRLFATKSATKYWDPSTAPPGQVKVPYNGSYRMHYEWWCTRQLQDTLPKEEKSDEWWKTLLGALEKATSEMRQGREHSMLGPVKEWDVSQITDMSSLFDEKRWHTSFDLSQWDVSNVRTMHRMFAGLSAKDKWINISNISKWNVSNVKNMNAMFAGFVNFNCDLSGWNVSNVKNMARMFEGCSAFNSNLSTWKDNVKNVTDMAYMFMSCSQFDSDLSGWKVSNVTDMECMFAYSRINSNLSKWKDRVGNVRNMTEMFQGATAFNNGNAPGVAEDGLKDWDVGKVTDMARMFERAASFNCNLEGWNVKSVETMQAMFAVATKFNCGRAPGEEHQLLAKWKVSNVNDMSSMFEHAVSFNGDLATWILSDLARQSLSYYEGTFFGAIRYKPKYDIGARDLARRRQRHSTDLMGPVAMEVE